MPAGEAVVQMNAYQTPRFDILFLSPGETERFMSPEASETTEITARLNTEQHHGGIGVTIGFNGDRNKIVETMISSAVEAKRAASGDATISENDIVLSGPDSVDVPLRQAVEHQLYNRNVTRAIAVSLMTGLVHDTASWYRYLEQRSLKHRLDLLITQTLGIAAVLGGVAIATHESPVIPAPTAAIGVGAMLWYGRKNLRAHIDGSTAREQRYARSAQIQNELVVRDVYRIFSADDFDQRFSESGGQE